MMPDDIMHFDIPKITTFSRARLQLTDTKQQGHRTLLIENRNRLVPPRTVRVDPSVPRLRPLSHTVRYPGTMLKFESSKRTNSDERTVEGTYGYRTSVYLGASLVGRCDVYGSNRPIYLQACENSGT